MTPDSITDKFADRHIGPNEEETKEMLESVGVNSLDELTEKTIPANILLKNELELDEPLTEHQMISKLRELASMNKIYKSYIGMGYYPTITPAVIQRNILENPGWYTQYTPYQAEISQGRLEALLNFQTMIIDLTGMDIANASLLDEATAAAEAMLMFHHFRSNATDKRKTIFVSENIFPQTLEVIRTRALPLGINVEVGDHRKKHLGEDVFAVVVQYPAGNGEIYDYSDFFSDARSKGINTIVVADIMSLCLLKPPGEFGADAVVGSTQRFGVPMGFGGPHAAYFATLDKYKRLVPGRIIGISIDKDGRKAYRMALQTREQHIRREKATSNICTAQVLLAIMASMYAVYHGPKRLREIAGKIYSLTYRLRELVIDAGYKITNENFFDTLELDISDNSELIARIRELALQSEINLRYDGNKIAMSLSEIDTPESVNELARIFYSAVGKSFEPEISVSRNGKSYEMPEQFSRESRFLTHPVFNSYRTETQLLRYMKSLENKDLSLTTCMIPLGSCTMKLNATAEMVAVTWPEFSEIHPFAPADQVQGYMEMINDLSRDLCRITEFDAISLQPNSGAQGEYAGLMVIRQYHAKRGDTHRNVCLIPSSAHGTNPASAVMAGMKVVVVNSDEKGNIDVSDLKQKAETHRNELSALMVTYPSTHGIFEESIQEICKIVHDNGGLVYMDGANMNAQVGLTSPRMIGADVCHLNLHKTFCIPHGGGGPGMGPIGVAPHLKEFLPGHPVVNIGTPDSITAVSAAPWGSPSILLISYAYIKMMGAGGLKKATQYSILNANYICARLGSHYKILYTGSKGTVAHEMIFDMREFRQSAKVDVEDIAKRLMDYNFHAPTVSFPVPGTMMVEPTESESKTELDRFCNAMISIREEIREIENGYFDTSDNVLKNAPHTSESIASDIWLHKYGREKAAFPMKFEFRKFWPSVSRIDSAYGDRNLVCSCNPVSDYAIEEVPAT